MKDDSERELQLDLDALVLSEAAAGYGEPAPRRELKDRTRGFALRIIRLYGALPKSVEAQVIGKQLLRSGTSVGAHYRESMRARSDAEFISKLQGALMELEETAYWLELLSEGGLAEAAAIAPLQNETDQLLAIFTAIVRKVKTSKRA